jgi:hypothetical protein
MASLFAAVNVSESVRHGLEVVAQGISEQLAHLSTKEQSEFWTEIHGYALLQTREAARSPLIASPHLEESVRRALQLTDEQIRTQIEKLTAADQQRFWEVLHERAQQAAEESTKGLGGRIVTE